MWKAETPEEKEWERSWHDRLDVESQIWQIMRDFLPILAKDTDLAPADVVSRAYDITEIVVKRRTTKIASLDREWVRQTERFTKEKEDAKK